MAHSVSREVGHYLLRPREKSKPAAFGYTGNMRADDHEETIDAAALRARLRHVYWIGGGSGAGKSTIARRIACRCRKLGYRS
jgi:ABC-type glutathione transport system ATPase component